MIRTAQRACWLKGFAVTAVAHGRTPCQKTARQIGPVASSALLAPLPVQLLCTTAHPLGIELALLGRCHPCLQIAGLQRSLYRKARVRPRVLAQPGGVGGLPDGYPGWGKVVERFHRKHGAAVQ